MSSLKFPPGTHQQLGRAIKILHLNFARPFSTRIEALSGQKKTTRPMKNGAGGPFRNSKEQGYTWHQMVDSKELHRMEEIFQVPDPTTIGNHGKMLGVLIYPVPEKCSLSEIRTQWVRSEVSMLGSKVLDATV
jgi:hypothetical protein